MTATPKELKLFYWYCHVATQIIGAFPSNEATRAVSLHAVRMATLNFAGKNGILLASEDARRIKEESEKAWSKCGLVREHAVPISVIHHRVVAAVRAPMTQIEKAAAAAQLKADMLKHGMDRSMVDEFPRNPPAWHVVQVVRELTHLCWVSSGDDSRLRAKPLDGGRSLHKAMPKDWDGIDPLARYRKCGIEVAPISQLLAQHS
jgi:hypothetical protein